MKWYRQSLYDMAVRMVNRLRATYFVRSPYNDPDQR